MVQVLVVEDDENMRDVLASVLEAQGYEVEAVGRGEEAVNRAREKAFDLIVTDIRMEGIDGLEALAQAKQFRPDVGSLVVSGYASESETLRAVALNVGGYLKKPFPMSDFLGRVREILKRRFEQLELAREREGFRAAFQAVLEALVGLADESPRLGRPGRLKAAGQLARRLAELLECAATEREELALAAMLTGAHRAVPALALDRLLKAAPLALRGFGAGLLPESQGVGPGLIELVLAACSEAHDELPSLEMLQGHQPALSELVLSAYARARQSDEGDLSAGAPAEVLSGLEDPARIDNSLLTLARSLEEGGDRPSAQRAYGEILSREKPTREAVQAALALARLTWEQGQPGAVEMALEVPKRAGRLGPVTWYLTLLETGLLLFRMGSNRCQELLDQAIPALEGLGFQGAAARGVVALSRFGRLEALPAALEALQQPRYASEVAEAIPWLLPELVRLAASNFGPARPVLGQVIVNNPRELSRLMARAELPAPWRQAILEAVEGLAAALPDWLWEQLASDPDPVLRDRSVRLRARVEGAPVPPILRLYSLGFFRVYRGDEAVPDTSWNTQKTRYLLAFLASETGRKFHEEVVLEEFWPNDRVRGKRSLYAATTTIRRNLRPEGTQHDFILREGEMLSLNWELPRWNDLEELEAACEAGQQAEGSGAVAQAVEQYRRVAQLYVAPYLDGCYLEWALRRREPLQDKALSALGRLALLLANSRQYQECLEHSNRILTLEAHRQEAHLGRMRAFLGLGQPENAIKQFEACERLLKKELGIEPNTELFEVYHRARNGMPDVSAS